MIQEGDPFPHFSLPDQGGNIVSNEDLRGRIAVIYFYPKDDTPGCTAEACEFQGKVEIGAVDARVVGISPDSVKSHRKFADKYGLKFTLLADIGHGLCDAVGAWVEKSMYGKSYMGVDRTTFVLDGDGIVRQIYRKVKPQGHAAEVLSALA